MGSSGQEPITIRSALVDGALSDLRIVGGIIDEIGPDLVGREAGEVIDAGGRAVLPGLHDHHLHLRALVATARSIPVGPPEVSDMGELRTALRGAAAREPDGGWLRAVGYHESVAGELDRWVLDDVVAHRPLRVQHRSGALWILNSEGLRALQADEAIEDGIERLPGGEPVGRLWRMDRWLADRLADATRSAPEVRSDIGWAGLRAASSKAAALGITGFTDATPELSDSDLASLAEASRVGAISQRLVLMTSPDTSPTLLDEFDRADLGQHQVAAGPVKVLLDDDRLPPVPRLESLIGQAHSQGRGVAVHCVTRVQFVLTTAAFDAAGCMPGDRIEHGAVIPAPMLPALAQTGLTVVTQPNFVAERGDDYLRDVPGDELGDLWRARSLVEAGVAVAAGTDAPFGRPDPWAAIDAAVRRTTASGAVLGAGEAVSPTTAYRWFAGSALRPSCVRRVTVGAPADLIVVSGTGRTQRPGDPSPVAVTLVGGRVTYRGPDI